MKTLFLVAPIAAMAALGGCVVTGSGKTETRDHALSGFDSIQASSGIDVVLTQGPFAVQSEAPEGKLDSIIVELSGRDLKIERKPEMMWFGSTGRYVVNVSAPAYAKITASGGADVEAASLQADVLAVDASGGADIDIKGAQIGMLAASATGGGDISLAGTCTSATVTASGGGDFDGEALDCETVTASAAGGGDIDVGARASATGNASAGGDVRFHGSPANFTANKDTGGDVSVERR